MAKTNKEEYVDLFVHREPGNDDPNVFIGINDDTYLLPKGKTSKVPLAVKEEYERSLRAREARLANSDRLEKKANEIQA